MLTNKQLRRGDARRTGPEPSTAPRPLLITCNRQPIVGLNPELRPDRCVAAARRAAGPQLQRRPHRRPHPPTAACPQVHSPEEFKDVLAANKDRMVVLMCKAMHCRPCKVRLGCGDVREVAERRGHVM